MKNRVEILAPAGSITSMQASFKAGADAVYMGGRRFGARAYADNPEDQELIRAIDYAHIRGKRLYLTVNTVVKEDELEELYDYLRPLYLHGLDAVIVQDMGVYNLVTRCFPDLPVHISTQMSITMAEATNMFKKNVTRVVPARELTIDEIAAMKKSGLELEVFVHGALCYSYSGQCLLSSACGDRSGNRGRCAQPCRMQYGLEDGNRKFILSPKDICTLDRIPDLIEAGVDSFKIEGRMKSPEYACGVVEIYKKAVDLYYQLGKEGYYKYISNHRELWQSMRIRLADLFNRGGFSEGYVFEKTGSGMMSVDRPNHEGVYVGNAIVRKGYAELKLEQPLFKGDVLEIRSGLSKEWYSYTTPVEQCKGAVLRFRALKKVNAYTEGVSVKVFRLRNESLLNELKENYVSGRDYVPVNGAIYLNPGTDLVLNVETAQENFLTGKKYFVSVSGGRVEEALNVPLTEEIIADKVARSGDSDFEFNEFDVEITGRPFLQKSALGAIRRRAFEVLSAEICADFSREEAAIGKFTTCDDGLGEQAEKAEEPDRDFLHGGRPDIVCFTTSVEQYKTCVSSGCVTSVCIDMDTPVFTWFCEKTQTILEEAKKFGKKIFIRTSHIADAKNTAMLKKIIFDVKKGITGFYVRNPASAFVIKEAYGRDEIKLIADKNIYVANSLTADYLYSAGFTGFVYPAEISFDEIMKLNVGLDTIECRLTKELCVYGREKVMISRQCIKNSTGKCNARREWVKIFSGTGATYPVFTDCENCRNHIYDANVLDITDEDKKIKMLNTDVLRYEFTDEKPDEIFGILDDNHEKGIRNHYTGHFIKGVM